jgi:hypothetical protein
LLMFDRPRIRKFRSEQGATSPNSHVVTSTATSRPVHGIALIDKVKL